MTDPQYSPVVYLGPTLAVEQARAIYPGCRFRPPVASSDLYADRQRGHGVFLIVDGEFTQQAAVSPREVIDVVRDGALVIGASSMGAIRAADCWPAGVRGVGRIYQMFRDWEIDADAEVAVATGDGEAGVSVALVNVRYAMERAVAEGVIAATQAAHIVACAAEIYYPARTWPAVLAAAGEGSGLLDYCRRHDLKRDDAVLAMQQLREIVCSDTDVFQRHARRSTHMFSDAQAARERGVDPLDGLEPQRAAGALFDWMIGSGRYWRHMPRIAAAQLGEDPHAHYWDDALHVGADAQLTRAAMRWLVQGPRVGAAALDAALRGLAVVLLREPQAFAAALWQELLHVGELDRELMRMAAVRRASEAAERAQLQVRAADLSLARSSIALAHGVASWEQLRGLEIARVASSQIARCLATLALAKRMRAQLFVGHHGQHAVI